MGEKFTFQQRRFPKGLLSLVAILLAFILLLVFIWLWYDIRITALDNKNEPRPIPQSTQ